MHCPSCQNSPLQPTKLEYGFPALGCKKCGGYLISILSYRLWADERGIDTTTGDRPLEVADDTKTALLCPKCERIMPKFRISGKTSNRVDVCLSCAEVWLDEGEWSLLKSLNLQDKLPTILSEPWQKAIYKEMFGGNQESKYEKLFGPEDYKTIRSFREWLTNHPQRAHIQDYINRFNTVDK